MKAIFAFLFCIPLLSFSQEAWITPISTPLFERVVDIREIPNGNYLAIGRRDESDDTGNPLFHSFFVEISQEGAIIRDQDIIIEDSSTSFHQIIAVSDTSFVVIGIIKSDIDGMNELWITHFNYDFEIIKQKKIPCFPDLYYSDFRAKFISNGNLLINGFVYPSAMWPMDMYFYETNIDGDSIYSSLIEIEGNQRAWEFLERKNGLGYYVYADGNFVVDPDPPGITHLVSFDTDYNLLSVDSVPRLISNLMNAKWLSGTSYLLSGKKYYDNPWYCNMGILKLDTSDNVINENYFGLLPDTITYAGSLDHLDFRDPDTIFYSGTGNFTEDYPYQFEPSWIIVNCLDSNLNLRWQTLYGGDAFYHSWEIYATSDGGCIVSASKFDYSAVPVVYDYDVVLLKYDCNGLLTSVGESEELSNSLLLYPNPGYDQIKIENNFDNGFFQMFDQAGRVILSTSLKKGSNIINVADINSGIYIYVVSLDQKPISSGKWIKW
jgi:hypothetical protein